METFTIFSFTIYDLLTTNHLGTNKRLKKTNSWTTEGHITIHKNQEQRTKNKDKRKKFMNHNSDKSESAIEHNRKYKRNSWTTIEHKREHKRNSLTTTQ